MLTRIQSPFSGGFDARNATSDRPVSRRKGLWNIAFSGGAALAVSQMGYYSLAGFTNVLLPEGSLGGILIRISIFSIILAAFARLQHKNNMSNYRPPLIPAGAFFFIYMLRLIDNCFFSDISLPWGADFIFSVFLISTVFSAFLMAQLARDVHDDDLIGVTIALNFLFVISLSLNLDALVETSDARMLLDKVNPISMSHTAVGFLLFHTLAFRKSKLSMLMALGMTPLLLLVIVYTRSRGAWVAGLGAIVVYVLLIKGTRRVWAVAGLGSAAFGTMLFASDYLDIIRERMDFTDIHSDQSTYVRYILHENAWRQFVEGFALGGYIVELSQNSYPHDLYLEVLMAVGVIGAIPFALHVLIAMRAAIGIIRSNKFMLAPVLTAVLFLRESIAVAMSGCIWNSSEYWTCSFLVIAFWYGRRRPRDERKNPIFGHGPASALGWDRHARI
jgi:hypothetical protein